MAFAIVIPYDDNREARVRISVQRWNQGRSEGKTHFCRRRFRRRDGENQAETGAMYGFPARVLM